MKITKIIYMAAAILLTACTADQETETTVGSRVPISLGYTLQEAKITRTVADNINDTYIAPGGQVYVNITSGSDVIYDGKYLVTKAIPDGETTKIKSEMAPMNDMPYYPLDGSTVDIKAYYPASAGSSFTVKNDQTSDEGYAASDLMWATPITNQGLSLTPVNLNFTHKLTKIVINVTAVEGIGSITAIRLTGVKPTVSFNNTTDGAVGEASGDATTISVAMGDNLSTGAAIIPAQAIDGAFVQIVTSSGTANFTVNKTFAANSCYTANINIGSSNIDLTNTITAWNEESFSTAGGYVAQSLGELANIINAGGAYREYLGKYVDANGKILPNSTGAVGAIAYMSTTPVDEDIPDSRILVMSLTDISDVTFSTNTTEYTGVSLDRGQMCGFKNTNILRTYYGGSTVGMKCYTYSASRPVLSSRWFCPSYGQWSAIMGADGVGKGTNDRTVLNLSTSTSYWSSTEVNEGAASVLPPSVATLTSLSKTSVRLARACFAYPHKGITLQASSIGWIISPNGLAYVSLDEMNAVGQTALAIVALSALDRKSNGEDSPYDHGLGMALTDDKNTIWSSNYSSDMSLTNRTDVAGIIADMSGISNTATIVSNSSTSAAYVAQHHASVIPGCSEWFLPASGQWINVLNRWGASITASSNSGNLGNLTTPAVNDVVINTMNASLSVVGGTQAMLENPYGYWTSTEYNNQYAIRIYFDSTYGIGIGNYLPKNSDAYHVRAFLAF